ncbi:MAG TPA: gliding motility-associated C-terminal domain-containing protein, partial [Bacteroidia bacterium]|nr:gliding motility-associated C-terminal domain-containing protein [Bacteroidia bacterium]
MCANQPNYLNFAATDANGDSLVYSLVKPYAGHTSASGPVTPSPMSAPYDTVTFAWPAYGMFNIVGGSPPMSINTHTCMITASPSTLGVYVFCVQVDEYRAGKKIGEVRWDVQYEVLSCSNNLPPQFVSPSAKNFTITAGDSLCLNVSALDQDGDWVSLHGNSELFASIGGFTPVEFSPDSAQQTATRTLCIKTVCNLSREAPYQAHFVAKDYSCYPSSTTTLDLNIYIKPAPAVNMDTLIANVFTPNGDGHNDFFMLRSQNLTGCFDSFSIKIYDRWGILLFESTDIQFKWDGHTKTGTPASDGIYYYLVSAGFNNVVSSYKGYVQL